MQIVINVNKDGEVSSSTLQPETIYQSSSDDSLVATSENGGNAPFSSEDVVAEIFVQDEAVDTPLDGGYS